jgi:transposase
VYRDVAQWTMVRQKVLDKGHSRRQVAKETGLSRNTIRKMLLNKLPQPYKPRTPRHPALQQYTATLDAFASLSVTTALRHRVSISEIYRCLKQEEGYMGSYGAVRDYLRFRFAARQASTKMFGNNFTMKSSPFQETMRLVFSNHFPLMARL